MGAPLVTVIVDTSPPVFLTTASYPSSTDANAPSIITQTSSATDFWVATRDAGSGIKYVLVSCVATDGSYSSGTVQCVKGEPVPIGGYTWEVCKWEAPILEEGRVYKFTWTAVDKAGRAGTLVTYGGYGDADGYFTLNGVPITSPTETIVLQSRTLDIGFHATVNPDSIVSVTVEVYKDSTLLKSDQLSKVGSDSWEANGFYTFAEDGTYTVKGYIDMSTKSLLKMSVIQTVGTDEQGWSIPDTGFSHTQLITFALGTLMVLYGMQGGEES